MPKKHGKTDHSYLPLAKKERDFVFLITGQRIYIVPECSIPPRFFKVARQRVTTISSLFWVRFGKCTIPWPIVTYLLI